MGMSSHRGSIESVDSDGLTARHDTPHGSHTHFVPFNELEQYELDQVAEWLKQKQMEVPPIEKLIEMIDALWHKAAPIKNTIVRQQFESHLADLGMRALYVKKRSTYDTAELIFDEYKKLLTGIEHELKHPTPQGKKLLDRPAADIYCDVKPEKLMPVEAIPWNLHQTVEIKDGNTFVIPHTDHFHNIKMELFDTGLYRVPDGYTIEQLFATVKYYVLYPDERPIVKGWGSDSNYGRNKRGGSDLPTTPKPTPLAEKPSDEEPTDDVPSDGEEPSDDITKSEAGVALELRLSKIAGFIEKIEVAEFATKIGFTS